MLSYLLPLVVNTLLNGLDAVTYGPLLIAGTVQAHCNGGASAGIGMYFLGTVTAQISLSVLSSFPRGIAACTMIESIPFTEAIARNITDMVVDTTFVQSTLIAVYFILTLITASGFMFLSVLDMERAIHQFPRAVLLGTMAGVGVFLVRTNFVSHNANPAVLLIGLLLGFASVCIERTVRLPFFLPICSLIIMTVFYSAAAASGVSLDRLRKLGWLSQQYSFDPLAVYKGFSFSRIDLPALVGCLPIAAGASLFNLLHIPINVPSYARYTSFAYHMDRELLAHAVTNVATAFAGLSPTYMAYTNSILFLKSGASDRIVGVLLGLTTLALMLSAGHLVHFIPSLLPVFLTSNLGFDLVYEAAINPLLFIRPTDYAIVLLVMIVTSVYGFLPGLVVGACAAVLILFHDRRTKATVRQMPHFTIIRSPERTVFRRQLIRRTHVVALQGHLYFGNCVSVVDELSLRSPDALFQVVDFTEVTSCDLNVTEGMYRYLQCPSELTVVLVNCEHRALMRHSFVYPSMMHALQHCEGALWDKMPSAAREEVADQIQAAKDMEARLLIVCDYERIYKEAGECVTLSPNYLLRLESGSGALDEEHFVDPGAWILPGQSVSFNVSSSLLLLNTTKASFELLSQLYAFYGDGDVATMRNETAHREHAARD